MAHVNALVSLCYVWSRSLSQRIQNIKRSGFVWGVPVQQEWNDLLVVPTNIFDYIIILSVIVTYVFCIKLLFFPIR